MKMKKILSAILAVSMVAALGAGALAADVTTAGETGNTAITATIQAADFSVTVPTTVAFAVASDGTVTAPSSSAFKIDNNCNGQVKVTDIAVAADAGWKIDAYGTDFTAVAVNSKEMTLSMNSTNAPATEIGSQNSLGTLTAANWPVLNGVDVSDTDDELPITATADFAEQATAFSNTVCHVIFTVNWNTAA